MERRQLGRTGVRVPVLGFGGIPIRDCTPAEAERVVGAAVDAGIEFFDTARGYGDSEEKLGRATRGRRDSLFLATKTPEREKAEAARDVEASLRCLDTGYIDLYQLHQVDTLEALHQVMGEAGALSALQEARRQGKIRYIGITGHNPAVLGEALRSGIFDTVQVPVNVLDRFIFRPEQELLPLAVACRAGVIAMKPLAGGVLKEASLALRYVLSQEVAVAIPGMRTEEEVRQNVAVARSFSPLTEEELDRLIGEAVALGTRVCRQCGYCLPCPQGIEIREVFRLEGMFDRYEQKEAARLLYAGLAVPPASCVECGQCESRCPYRLPIRDRLKVAAGKLEGVTT